MLAKQHSPSQCASSVAICRCRSHLKGQFRVSAEAGGSSWRTVPLRGNSHITERPLQEDRYTTAQSPRGDATAAMQPAVWVDASDSAAVLDSTSRQMLGTSQRDQAGQQERDGNYNRQAFDGPPIEPPASASGATGQSNGVSKLKTTSSTFREGKGRDMRQQTEWQPGLAEAMQSHPYERAEASNGRVPQGQEHQRGSQRTDPQEQPGFSGRQDYREGSSFGGLFRGRNLNFWARGSSPKNPSSGTARGGGEGKNGKSLGGNSSSRSTEDDWAVNEVILHEEEDGWGGSYVGKQDRQSAQKVDSRKSSNNARSPSAYTWEPDAQEEADRDFGYQEGEWDRQQANREKEPPPDYSLHDPEKEEQDEPEGILDAELLDERSDWNNDNEDWEEGILPDITPLAPDEADELLPIIPTPDQMSQNWGSAIELGQRAAAALALTVITSKFNLVLFATGSATFVFWGPVLGAINRNRLLRNSGRFVGLWRATVKAVQLDMPERRSFASRQGYAPSTRTPSLKLLLGDESGARSQLILPHSRRYETIQVGEAAELLVLSSQPGFKSFRALKEVYLPESGLWLSDYPHVNRNLFLEVSLEIERERKMSMAEGAFEIAA